MAEKDKGKVFIVVGIIAIIVLMPLLKAKPLEMEGEVISTEFTRVNGLLK